MKKRIIPLFLIFFLLTIDGICWAQLYKWVDEKGTVHFSDSPPPGALKSQSKDQTRVQGKDQVKTEEKGQEKRPSKNQSNPPEKQPSQEDTLAILKRLEVGNRQIPDDMKKYGPGGGYEAPRGGSDQTVSSPSVQRSSS